MRIPFFSYMVELIKKKNWLDKASGIFGILVLTGAVFGVAYGVITNNKDEGFIVSNGFALKWDKKDLPLGCMYKPMNMNAKFCMFKAIQEYENRTGIDLIQHCEEWMVQDPFPSKPLRKHVLIHIGNAPKEEPEEGNWVETPWDVHPGGTTLILPKKEDHSSIYGVMLYVGEEYRSNCTVWLHEFGHTWGLGHDRRSDSVMWPNLEERPAKLSDKDVDHLKGAYVVESKGTID